MKNDKKEHILITGITGFVGSHLADYILKTTHANVFGLKRWNLDPMRNVAHLLDNSRVKFFDCDITDPIGSKYIINTIKPDKVFHLAAESFVSPSWRHPSHYIDVNFKGTVNLLDAIRDVGINPRFLIPGSGEEYGEIYEHELPITEQTILRPVNPYAVSKIAQDFIGYVYFRSYGLNVIRTRAFNHEGPRRDYVFGIPWYAYQIARIEAGKQEPILTHGHIEDRRNFTHIEDLVAAYWLAMEYCEPGDLYLIGEEKEENTKTYREIIQMLIGMSSVRDIMTKQDPELVRPTAVPRLIGDTSKFRKLTGWKPNIPLTIILKDTLEYWREFVHKDLY